MQSNIHVLFAPMFLPVNLQATRLPSILKVRACDRAAITCERRRRFVTLHEGSFQRSLNTKRAERRRETVRAGEAVEEYRRVGPSRKRKVVEVQATVDCFMFDPRPPCFGLRVNVRLQNDPIDVEEDSMDMNEVEDMLDPASDVDADELEVEEILSADSDMIASEEHIIPSAQAQVQQSSTANLATTFPHPATAIASGIPLDVWLAIFCPPSSQSTTYATRSPSPTLEQQQFVEEFENDDSTLFSEESTLVEDSDGARLEVVSAWNDKQHEVSSLSPTRTRPEANLSSLSIFT